MKVTQDETEFRPIIIVLHSRMEADLLHTAVNDGYKNYEDGTKERLIMIQMANKLNECDF